MLVQRSLTPRDPQFGDTVVASADVTVDPRRVDPRSVTVRSSFGPYSVVSGARTVHSAGGLSTTHLERRLRCLDVACVPAGDRVALRLPPLRVSYRDGSGEHALAVAWPVLRVHSRVAAADLRHPLLRVPPPQPGSDYRLPPRPTGLALLALAAVLALGGAALLLRLWAPRPAGPRRRQGTRLERLLGELSAAAANGDAGRRRRALESLARELELLDGSLSAESRVLAWAPQDPQPAAISALTGRVRAAVAR